MAFLSGTGKRNATSIQFLQLVTQCGNHVGAFASSVSAAYGAPVFWSVSDWTSVSGGLWEEELIRLELIRVNSRRGGTDHSLGVVKGWLVDRVCGVLLYHCQEIGFWGR